MQLKRDEQGKIIEQEGKPVFVNDEGKEIAYDVPSLVKKVREYGNESKERRLANEELKSNLKQYRELFGEDYDNAKKAHDALSKLQSLDAGDLKRAEEVQKQLDMQKSGYEAKLQNIQQQLEQREELIQQKDQIQNNMMIDYAFNTSAFLRKNTETPPEILKDVFKKSFKVDENKQIYAVDKHGEPILSDENPGMNADFEEALSKLIATDPNREWYLKGTMSGSGALPSSGSIQGSMQADVMGAMSMKEYMNTRRKQRGFH